MMGPRDAIVLRLHDDMERTGMFLASTYQGGHTGVRIANTSTLFDNSPAPSPSGVHVPLGFQGESSPAGVMAAGGGGRASRHRPVHSG